MSRTITALFDTREDADAGRQRLLAADVDADNVRIHDQSTMSSSMGSTSDVSSSSTSSSHSSQDSGIWGSIKNAFLPDEDRHTYEEGIRRGGYLLTADVDEDEVDAAVRALKEANSVDMNDRSQTWRSEGWSVPATSATSAFFNDDHDRAISESYKMSTDEHVENAGSTHTDADRSTAADHSTTESGSTLSGLANEGMGNIKQGIAGVTGDEELKHDGEAQERNGETQQGKTPGSGY